MRYHDLVDRVQEKGELGSHEEAVTAIQATLSTLGECLYRTERRHLASQLPKEAKTFLSEQADPTVTRQEAACHTLQAFYDRVGARAEVTRGRAVEQAKAVMAVLSEAVPPGEWQHIVAELPKEYGELLTGGSEGSTEAPA